MTILIMILLSIIVLLGLYAGYQKATVMDKDNRLKEAEGLLERIVKDDPFGEWSVDSTTVNIKKFLGVE